jgi:hypothetical protein
LVKPTTKIQGLLSRLTGSYFETFKLSVMGVDILFSYYALKILEPKGKSEEIIATIIIFPFYLLVLCFIGIMLLWYMILHLLGKNEIES